ncbi:MAG: hypothetical protein HY938_01425 [Nitrosomonadales bacterium]|nr:hypothetical protein [Nitrosomonadales bacterium]
MTIASKRVKTRRVYYISGYDPRGARHYHRLYSEEAARQAARRGYEISVSARGARPGDNAGWSVDSHWPEGDGPRTDYRFLVWDDIVRRHWEKSMFRLLGQCLIGYGRYLVAGVLRRISHSHRGIFFSVMLPAVFAGLWALTLLLVLSLWSVLCKQFMPYWFLWMLGAAALSLAVLWLGSKLGDRLGVFWLMRTILFVEKWGAVGNPEMEGRIDRFAVRLSRDQAENPVDEVLLVGHSVGSVIAAAVASRYLRGHPPEGSLTLITLGQCIPLLAFTPAAVAYRNEIVSLATDGRIKWFDISAKADPLCFFDENPALVCNAPAQAPGTARMVHARIFKMFSPETYKTIRGNKLRLHFQYLMAAELDTGYDYFRLTAGPLPATSQLDQ